MGKITFKEDVCKGCGLCISVCPKKIIELDEKKLNKKGYNPADIRKGERDICILCGMCATMCPDLAIELE